MSMKKAPVGRPRGADQVNSSRRRKQLVDAAISSIVENGLSATTLATVAKASGLSQGTAVFYFKTKDRLLSEAFQHRMEEYSQRWNDAIASADEDPVRRIIAMAFHSVHPDIITRDNLAFWNEFWPEASRSESLNAVFKRAEAERQRTIKALFEEARPALAHIGWEPELAGQAVETVVEGIWARLHYSPGYLSHDGAISILEHTLASIFPDYRDAIARTAREVKAPAASCSYGKH